MTDLPNKDLNGRYASVNGLQIYYEVHGTGGAARPLVLLHGGLGVIGMFEYRKIKRPFPPPAAASG